MNGKAGAGDRARTGDLDLGKVALYQLSYARFMGYSVAKTDNIFNPGPDELLAKSE